MNTAHAIRAGLCNRYRSGLWPQPVDILHDNKHRKCDKQEIDHICDKQAVVKCRCPRIFGHLDGFLLFTVKGNEKVRKIKLAGEDAYNWHEDVINKGRNNFPKGGSNNDTNCNINHIAAQSKLFESLQ